MLALRYVGLILAAPILATLVGDTMAGDAPKAALKPFEGKGLGSIKGKVIYDGTPPTPADLAARDDIKAHKDFGVCTKGDMKDQTWKVKNGAVANVVIYVDPPAGTYFGAPSGKKSWPDEVVVDQPFCAFEPHVAVIYPGYTDRVNKKFVPSGQKFVIKNSAAIGHNTKYIGDAVVGNGENLTLEPSGKKELKLKPQKGPITVQCDFHKWMTGYWFALDHPYAAVTKDDGTFEINNIPAGTELTLKAWHEAGGEQTKKVKIEENKQVDVPDIKVKAK